MNSHQQLDTDYAPYIDQWGLIQNIKGETSGRNGLIYTGEYVLALVDNKFLTEDDKERLKKVYASCERLPGLLLRNPKIDDDYNAHDDIIGACVASKFIDNGALTKRILDHGQLYINGVDPNETNKTYLLGYEILKALTFNRIKWNWNTVHPQKFHSKSWLGRRGETISTLQMSVGRWPSMFYFLWWNINVLIQSRTEKYDSSHDGWILTYLMCRACGDYNFITRYVSNKFYAHFEKTWGNLGNCLAEYFNDGNQHPHGKWLQASK